MDKKIRIMPSRATKTNVTPTASNMAGRLTKTLENNANHVIKDSKYGSETFQIL